MVVSAVRAIAQHSSRGQPSKMQQTDLGPIPDDWRIATLADLIDPDRPIRYGIVQPGKYDPHGRYMIRGQDYADGWSDRAELFRVSDPVEHKYRNARVRFGDVLITIVGASTGRIATVPDWLDGANLTQTTARIAIASPEASSRYCAHVLASWYGRTQTINYMKGGAQPGLNCGDVDRFLIPLPPTRGEQEVIAEALADADALIEALKSLIAKKSAIRRGAMQELLSGRRRLAGFDGRWVNKPIGELANVHRGASPRPIDDPVWFDDNSQVGWVRISDVTASSKFLHETKQKLSKSGIAKSRLVARGSLIMSICATVGRPVITCIDTCIHDGFVVFCNLTVDQVFLFYALSWIENDWSKHGQTGSQMNLNTGLIKATEIALPEDWSEQAAIGAFLSDMDDELAALKMRLVKTRQVKLGMMQELLTGRVRLA